VSPGYGGLIIALPLSDSYSWIPRGINHSCPLSLSFSVSVYLSFRLHYFLYYLHYLIAFARTAFPGFTHVPARLMTEAVSNSRRFPHIRTVPDFPVCASFAASRPQKDESTYWRTKEERLGRKGRKEGREEKKRHEKRERGRGTGKKGREKGNAHPSSGRPCEFSFRHLLVGLQRLLQLSALAAGLTDSCRRGAK
jgi:hypothetical protein